MLSATCVFEADPRFVKVGRRDTQDGLEGWEARNSETVPLGVYGSGYIEHGALESATGVENAFEVLRQGLQQRQSSRWSLDLNHRARKAYLSAFECNTNTRHIWLMEENGVVEKVRATASSRRGGWILYRGEGRAGRTAVPRSLFLHRPSSTRGGCLAT